MARNLATYSEADAKVRPNKRGSRPRPAPPRGRGGALPGVTAFASLSGSPLDEYLARTVLKDVMPGGDSGQITPTMILEETAGYFIVSVEEIQGASRSRNLTRARQIAMYLCRELTDLSLPKIGETFDRDHTTVMYAYKKISELMKERRSIYNQVTEITTQLGRR